MAVGINLRCWTCAGIRAVGVEMAPRFAFEVAVIADTVGWRGCFDSSRARVLVFCSERCETKARRRDGGFRLRPPRVEARP